MKIFDYSFLKLQGVHSSLISLIIDIEKIKGFNYKNFENYPSVFENLQSISNFQSVKYSNFNKLAFSDYRLKNILYLKKESKNELNVMEDILLGYKDVLKIVHNNHNELLLNEYLIKDFHFQLFSDTSLDNIGNYKYENDFLMEILLDGTKKVIFNPISFDESSIAMNNLIQAYKIARDDIDIPKLLLIPCVILDFLLIYPFSYGNEQISNLISMLLLYKNDYNACKYVSFEKQIYNNKSEYYEAIRKSSINWDENLNDYNPFIKKFLEMVYSAYYELNSRFRIVDGEKKSKKIRIKETILKSYNPISRKEIHLVWPDISQETIKKEIKNLMIENKIKKIGGYKDARYKRNWYGSSSKNDENMVIF